MKKLLCSGLALILIFSLSACSPNSPVPGEDYLPGTPFDPADYDTASVSRYENRLYGIIMEYPERFERFGNLDLDGYITFE